MLLAVAVLLAGAALHAASHPGEAVDWHVFRGEPRALRSVRLIVEDAWAGRSEAMIQLGILLLVATPVARVLLAAFGFAWERDRLYSGVALAVFAILVFSLLGRY